MSPNQNCAAPFAFDPASTVALRIMNVMMSENMMVPSPGKPRLSL
jgi:hypothetical protein